MSCSSEMSPSVTIPLTLLILVVDGQTASFHNMVLLQTCEVLQGCPFDCACDFFFLPHPSASISVMDYYQDFMFLDPAGWDGILCLQHCSFGLWCQPSSSCFHWSNSPFYLKWFSKLYQFNIMTQLTLHTVSNAQNVKMLKSLNNLKPSLHCGLRFGVCQTVAVASSCYKSICL